MESVYFFLVHGTFAQKSTWTKENSLLRSQIESKFKSFDPRFVEMKWSGRNNDEDRTKGGKALYNLILKTCGSNKKKFIPFFIIGHSHGNDVILKCMDIAGVDNNKAFLDASKGMVSFNAPFIFTLKRDFGAGLSDFFKIGKLSIILTLLISMAAIFLDIYNNTIISLLSYIPQIAIFVSLFMIYFTFISIFISKSEKHLQRIFEKQVAQSVYYRKNPADILAINSSGDEALNGLSLLGGIANLPFFFMHKIIMAFYALAVYSHSVHTITRENAKSDGSTNICDPLLLPGCKIVASVVNPTEDSFFVVLQAVMLTAINFFSMLLLLALVGWLLGMIYFRVGLGIAGKISNENSLLAPLFFRRSVALLPLNVNSVFFVDSGVGGSFLSHSVPHSDPKILDIACKWLLRRFAQSPPLVYDIPQQASDHEGEPK